MDIPSQSLPPSSPRSELSGKTVLVTGGTGFVGGRLIERLVLAHGARVRVLVRDFSRASRIARFPVEMVAGSITSPETVRTAAQGCSVVFHCAYGNRGTEAEQWASHVDGTENIARAVQTEGVERLVHVSSLAVYGKTRSGVINETEPRAKWHDTYSEGKRQAERILLALSKRKGLPVVVIQPGIVYGPHAGWTTQPLEWLSQGQVVLVDGGEGLCNCVYIDDLVEALLLAATAERVLGETFLISSGETVTWREFLGCYEQMLGIESTCSISARDCYRHEFRARMTPRLAQRIANKLQTDPRLLPALLNSRAFQHPALRAARSRLRPVSSAPGPIPPKPIQWPNRTQIDLGVMQTRASIDKARSMLDYRPRFDLATGMAWTRQWAEWAHLLPSPNPIWPPSSPPAAEAMGGS
jgi:nucleoside-diphosphate-sugar epimerase